jgi:uncharacterized cupin superfamily protein
LVEEARLERRGSGLAPGSDGWFVVNARDATWVTSDVFGSDCSFESFDSSFEQFGIRIQVLFPGRPSGLYHREDMQEDFLVLSGECLLLVEGEERRLRAWDFVHSPPNTEHLFVGAGDRRARSSWPVRAARTGRSSIRYPSRAATRSGRRGRGDKPRRGLRVLSGRAPRAPGPLGRASVGGRGVASTEGGSGTRR